MPAADVVTRRGSGHIQTLLDAAQALGHIADDKANPARWERHLDKLLPKPAKLSRGHQTALPYADVPAFVAQLRVAQVRWRCDDRVVYCVAH